MLFKKFIQNKAVKGLWKENLNIDSHQSHQYQRNEQAPFILTELTEHIKTTTYDVEHPGPGLRQRQSWDPNHPLLITASSIDPFLYR